MKWGRWEWEHDVRANARAVMGLPERLGSIGGYKVCEWEGTTKVVKTAFRVVTRGQEGDYHNEEDCMFGFDNATDVDIHCFC